MKRDLKIQVVRSKRLFWHINIIAPNNRIRLTSETYFNKSSAVRAAKTLSQDTGWEIVIK